jgi:hypothetical protein
MAGSFRLILNLLIKIQPSRVRHVTMPLCRGRLRKNMPGRNTPAYFVTQRASWKKSFIALTPEPA